jgi:hypothetical protein
MVLLFTSGVYASIVKAVITPKALYKGDSAALVITATGEDVKFPQIDSIGGYEVTSTSVSNSTTIVNSDVSHQVSKSYFFTPLKSLNIPPYKVIVDGKEYKTEKLSVKVLKPTASKKGDDFILKIETDKKEAFVGEAINLTVTFKQKIGAKATNIELTEPKLQNFWIKKSKDIEKDEQNGYIVQKLRYLLFPQKSGEYEIKPLRANIGKLVERARRGGIFDDPFFNDPFFDDPFFNRLSRDIKWQKIYSNSIKLHIKPLPNNQELFGNFKIEASVDKKRVKANKPVNLTVKVYGEGNIDDVKKFDLDIDDAIVYADDPTISSSLKNGKYMGEFTQKIAIVADKNFTIPSLKLSFIDKDTKKQKTIKTAPIDIEVIGGESSHVVSKVETSTPKSAIKETTSVKDNDTNSTKTEQPNKPFEKYLYLLAGLLIGVGGMLLTSKLKTREKKEKTILQKIKRAKSDRELFDLLLPLAKEDDLISETLKKLEKNIYANEKNSIDKEALIEFFEDRE